MSDPQQTRGATPQGRIAGIDYGTVRVGIALADLEIGIATPFATYTRRSRAADAEFFRRLALDERLLRFVVGLPVHASGHESQKSHEARRFGAWLGETTGLEVHFFDERYTSAEAEAALMAAQLTKKKRQGRIDQLAAQIMLASYLDAGRLGQESVDALDG